MHVYTRMSGRVNSLNQIFLLYGRTGRQKTDVPPSQRYSESFRERAARQQRSDPRDPRFDEKLD